MERTRKLTMSAIYIALYIVIIFLTSSVSFGAIQVRLANSMYALAFCYPFLVLPAGISVLLSNILFGGLGLPDMIGGFLVAIITTYLITLVRKHNLNKGLIASIIVVVPSLLVSIWLSVLLQLPYWPLVVSLMLGHVIPSIIGLILVSSIELTGKAKEDINE